MRTRIVYPSAGDPSPKRRFFIDDKEVTEEQYRATLPPFDIGAASTVAGPALAGYPFASTAIEYHPDQIPEAREMLVKAGVPTDINADGQAIIRDRAHKRELCKALGYFDRDGGYSDAQRGSYRGHY